MSNVKSIVVDPELIIQDRTLEKFGSGTGTGLGSRPYLALLTLEAALLPRKLSSHFINFYQENYNRAHCVYENFVIPFHFGSGTGSAKAKIPDSTFSHNIVQKLL
jgi:hypothetical protein